MSSIQFDYSTLSTSASHGEFVSSTNGYYVDGSNIISEEEISQDEKSDSNKSSSSETPVIPVNIPVDKFHIVYITFGLLGIAVLLPFNFFITANDFWMYKFRDVTNATNLNPLQPTKLQATFTSYMSFATSIPFVIILTLGSRYSQRCSQAVRILGSILIATIIFISVTALVEVNSDKWQESFFTIIMVFVVILGSISAILQSSTIGIASLFPPKYMQINMLGQTVAGIVSSVAQLISLLGHASETKSAFSYFMSANVFLIFTFTAYVFIQKSKFFQFYINCSKGVTVMKDVSSSPPIRPNIPLFFIIKRVLPFGLSLTVNMWVTLGIFPGLAVLVQSVDADESNIFTTRLFLPLACFILYNMSDFCGRMLSGWIYFPHQHGYRLLAITSCRIIFFPLFILCNAYPRHNFPVIFNSDIYYIAFIALLGITNGIFITIPLLCGSKCLTAEFQESAGLVLTAFLGIGIMLGSVTSYLCILIL